MAYTTDMRGIKVPVNVLYENEEEHRYVVILEADALFDTGFRHAGDKVAILKELVIGVQ